MAEETKTVTDAEVLQILFTRETIRVLADLLKTLGLNHFAVANEMMVQAIVMADPGTTAECVGNFWRMYLAEMQRRTPRGADSLGAHAAPLRPAVVAGTDLELIDAEIRNAGQPRQRPVVVAGTDLEASKMTTILARTREHGRQAGDSVGQEFGRRWDAGESPDLDVMVENAVNAAVAALRSDGIAEHLIQEWQTGFIRGFGVHAEPRIYAPIDTTGMSRLQREMAERKARKKQKKQQVNAPEPSAANIAAPIVNVLPTSEEGFRTLGREHGVLLGRLYVGGKKFSSEQLSEIVDRVAERLQDLGAGDDEVVIYAGELNPAFREVLDAATAALQRSFP